MPTSGGDQKATITDLDANTSIEVQFNPAELQLSDSARWRPQNHATRPSLSYESGDPSTLRLELTFDGTRGGGDVEADHLRGLRAFLEQGDRSGSDGRSISRPPFLQFAWANFRFVGVLTRLDIRYTMFKPDGTPVRAKATLTLTEHTGDEIRSPAAAVQAPAAGASTATVGPGQTLSQVAQQNGTTTADLARANNVADPLDVAPGTTLAVPKSPEMAAAMERSRRSEVPTAWGGGGGGADALGQDLGGAAAGALGVDPGLGRAAGGAAAGAGQKAAAGNDPTGGAS